MRNRLVVAWLKVFAVFLIFFHLFIELIESTLRSAQSFDHVQVACLRVLDPTLLAAREPTTGLGNALLK